MESVSLFFGNDNTGNGSVGEGFLYTTCAGKNVEEYGRQHAFEIPAGRCGTWNDL